MEYRGHILLVFGLSLIATPYSIKVVQEARAADAAPTAVVTEGAANAACNDAAIETVIGRLGCHRNAAERETRRVDGSGALFVQAKR